ncbi:MAG: hypothetical protein AB4057_18000 [Crocosphaera sp.]
MTFSVKAIENNYPKPSPSKRGLSGFIDNLSTDLLLGLTSGTLVLSLFNGTGNSREVLTVSLWCFIIILYLVFHKNSNRRLSKLQNWIAKYGLMPTLSTLLAVVYLFDRLILPSQALFFNNVRTKISGMFTGSGYAGAAGATKAINIGTYALEALMVGYIVYGVVKAIQAGRDDEDWKQPLKLPLLVLFTCAAGDQAITLL